MVVHLVHDMEFLCQTETAVSVAFLVRWCSVDDVPGQVQAPFPGFASKYDGTRLWSSCVICVWMSVFVMCISSWNSLYNLYTFWVDFLLLLLRRLHFLGDMSLGVGIGLLFYAGSCMFLPPRIVINQFNITNFMPQLQMKIWLNILEILYHN